MRRRPIFALVAKDARLHWRSIVFTQVGTIALVCFASLVPRPPDVLATLIFNLNFFFALMWGEWLISREKLKGTLAWLRTMPVSDRELVAAKFLVTSACSVLLWLITSLAFTGRYFAEGRAATWLILLLSLLAFGALSAAVRWRFNQKLGLTVPLLVVLFPLLIFIAAKREGVEAVRALGAFWSEGPGKPLAAGMLATLFGASYLLTERWVRRSDTFLLLE